MNLLWKEQLQEAAVTSTSGQADVEAGVTEPRSLGKGPWAAEMLPYPQGWARAWRWVASLSFGKALQGQGLRPLS